MYSLQNVANFHNFWYLKSIECMDIGICVYSFISLNSDPTAFSNMFVMN